jgi:hypothetical protein
MFTRVCHWREFWSKWIQSTLSNQTSTLILFSHLYLRLPSDFFCSGFPTKMLLTEELFVSMRVETTMIADEYTLPRQVLIQGKWTTARSLWETEKNIFSAEAEIGNPDEIWRGLHIRKAGFLIRTRLDVVMSHLTPFHILAKYISKIEVIITLPTP